MRSFRLGLFFFCSLITHLLASDGILIKIHSQANVDQLKPILDKYYENLSQKVPYHIILSTDAENAGATLISYPNLTILSSKGKSNTEAINLGISDHINKYNFLLITSDEIEPNIKNYDTAIIAALSDNDSVLNLVSEGRESTNIAPAMGKKYFQRFGYVYNPVYNTSSYDRELTCISRILGKETIPTQSILKKINPIAKALSPRDEMLFHKRHLNNFGISEATLQEIFTKDWSILICTLDEREEPFTYIYNKLDKQIKDNHLENKIEILVFKDNRENTIGFKRNSLLKQSRGAYVNFIDDDDDVHDNYITMIHEKMKSKPDCVSLIGIITFDDANPAKFIHSIKFKNYFQANGIYFRPPNHLNPMKRSIAAQYLFPSISFGEDTDWAMRICKDHLLVKEEEITTPYYFYKYVTKK